MRDRRDASSERDRTESSTDVRNGHRRSAGHAGVDLKREVFDGSDPEPGNVDIRSSLATATPVRVGLEQPDLLGLSPLS